MNVHEGGLRMGGPWSHVRTGPVHQKFHHNVPFNPPQIRVSEEKQSSDVPNAPPKFRETSSAIRTGSPESWSPFT